MDKIGNNQQIVQSSTSLSSESRLIKDVSESEIKMLLAYLFVFIGLKDSEIPTDDHQTGMLRKTVLINFIKKMLWRKSIEEIKFAFELAVSKKIDIDLSLYGGTFSAKMVMEVIDGYEKYKSKNVKIVDEFQMNNIQRLASINNFLSEETKAKLEKLGKEEVKPKPKLNRGHDVFQKWMALFDKLKRNYEVTNTNGRFIKRYGLILNLEGFINYKTAQLSIVTAYLNDRNNDVL